MDFASTRSARPRFRDWGPNDFVALRPLDSFDHDGIYLLMQKDYSVFCRVTKHIGRDLVNVKPGDDEGLTSFPMPLDEFNDAVLGIVTHHIRHIC